MTADVMIIGGGAAGLATAIFAGRAAAPTHAGQASPARIVILDGAKSLGAKILVAGGGRCNVTNMVVTPRDFAGGSQAAIRRVLSALSVEKTVAFFREIGVELYEDYDGKLFPTTNKARSVLDALLREAARVGVDIRTGHRVVDVERRGDGFVVLCEPAGGGRSELAASAIVLATGGLSLPKTGSDGGGYALARKLGHSLVPTTPALDPLLLDGAFHASLSGVSHPAEMTVAADGEKPVRRRGSLLWTHFGVSGPLALDCSRYWNRAKLENRPVSVRLSFLPGETFESVEKMMIAAAADRPKSTVQSLLAGRLPGRVASAVAAAVGVGERVPLAHLSKPGRRSLIRALIEFDLPVRGTRGYRYAEVTAGGVPLSEIEPATMESRVCPGLYLVGEILDVDGRIGGFNFQWAWASGFAAGGAALRKRGGMATACDADR
ncbi:tricarballylate dehydrogenase [Phycisphaerae bacterium RAS1]|nr:tricarballylate dehydrogenase [Phycisphaerae bacterium RAS1]